MPLICNFTTCGEPAVYIPENNELGSADDWLCPKHLEEQAHRHEAIAAHIRRFGASDGRPRFERIVEKSSVPECEHGRARDVPCSRCANGFDMEARQIEVTRTWPEGVPCPREPDRATCYLPDCLTRPACMRRGT